MTTDENFWQKLRKNKNAGSGKAEPIFALAPMADVTDPAFRRIIAKYGKPDILWTEFVSADGLMLGGREKLLKDLLYTEAERPIVAQLFGSNIETMRASAKLCTELGFDGIDINMGCPDRSIEKQGAGAATMKNPKLAVEIIRAAKEGIMDAVAEAQSKINENQNKNKNPIREIPLSVKTRIGYNKNEIETWLPVLLAENLSAITVHLRTRKEMSKVPARWDHMREITTLRDKISPETLIIGNGDVRDVAHGRELVQKYGADGVMIGRAIFGNPWLFSPSQLTLEPRSKSHKKSNSIFRTVLSYTKEIYGKIKQKFGYKNRYWLENKNEIEKSEKLRVLIEHSKLFEELLGEVKNFAVMKKHFKAYVNGWPGSKDLRMALMEAKNANDVEEIISRNS